MSELGEIKTAGLAAGIALLLLLTGVAPPLVSQVVSQPVISALNPTTVPVGEQSIILTVSGANFVSGSTVIWNALPLSTTFSSANLLTASVSANLLTFPGTIFVSVRNPDGGTSPPAILTITATPLAITTTTLTNASVAAPYSVLLQATGGSPPYSWTAIDALPAGITLSAAGVLSGTPSASGTFNFTLRVNDVLQASATRTLTLTVSPAQLTITNTSPLPAARVGTAYTVTFSAAGGAAPYQWELVGAAPEGLALNTTTGVLSGTPIERGEASFTVRVSDASGSSATKQFALTIQPRLLTITTEPPLFDATVGVFYSQNFFASGGIPPYQWAIAGGQLPPGLSFDTNTGSLTGTPTTPGAYNISVRVTDSASMQATRSYTVTVALPRLTILSSSLPAGTVGTSYSHTVTATGGSPPYTWSITSGQVSGLNLNSTTGELSGTPVVNGAFSLTIQVRDSAQNTSSRSLSLTINPAPLRITTNTQLPPATVGAAYEQTISAVGGVAPYSWSANGLPEGLTIDAATGVIRGTPLEGGSPSFTVRVIDAARVTATDLFRLTIQLPPLPAVEISGLPEVSEATEQFGIRLHLSAPYPARVSGRLTLGFTPESGSGDTSVQFSSGGRTVDFTIEPGQTEAQFAVENPALQTGTVAGTIRLMASLASGDVDLTPSPAPEHSTRIERRAPVIRTATLQRNANGFSIRITGYSTSLEMTQAVFRFRVAAGNTLQQSELTIPVESLFSQWYQDANAARFGSQFLFTQEFTVSGGNASLITPESVTLTNRVGSTTAQIQ